MNIVYYYSKLNIGGAEKSTVRLLNLFCEKGHDVTLLLRWSGGLLEHELDPRVHIIYLKKEQQTHLSIGKTIVFLRETVLSVFRSIKLKDKKYDICINGLFGYDPGFLFRNICAAQFYQMLRNDVSQTGNYGKTREYMKIYGNCFDAYIGVSQYTTESFKMAYPELSDKAYTIYNVLPQIPIIHDEDPYQGYNERFKIVSVCRLVDKAKGLFRMANVCAELRKLYEKRFVWFIVGDGPDGVKLEERIRELNLEDHMVLCGEQNNPFTYYEHADLVAVLSYYEGLCGVVNEAKMMQRPVIATEFSGIHEQITDGVNGIIVENNEAAILSKMRTCLENPELLTKYMNNDLPKDLQDNDLKVRHFEMLFRAIEKEKTNAKS